RDALAEQAEPHVFDVSGLFVCTKGGIVAFPCGHQVAAPQPRVGDTLQTASEPAAAGFGVRRTLTVCALGGVEIAASVGEPTADPEHFGQLWSKAEGSCDRLQL